MLMVDQYFFLGAAYVFVTNDSGVTWSQVQRLVASDGEDNDVFGTEVAIYSNVIVLAALHDSDKGAYAGKRRNRYCNKS